MQQQQPEIRSHAFTPFRLYTLDEIPQTYAWFEEMRTNHPVSLGENMPLWQVFRYEDVATVITDYTRFSSRPLGAFAGSFLQDTLVVKDPPDHRKLRNLINQAFTPRAVARLSERITQITQELLDQVRHQGKMDIVSDIAFPLPAKLSLRCWACQRKIGISFDAGPAWTAQILPSPDGMQAACNICNRRCLTTSPNC